MDNLSVRHRLTHSTSLLSLGSRGLLHLVVGWRSVARVQRRMQRAHPRRPVTRGPALPARARRAAASLLFVGLGLQGQGVFAQSVGPGQISPQYDRIDQNGIDLGTGTWAGQLASISIGDPAQGGIEWTQPANGVDSLSAIMIYGPGGNLSVSQYGFVLNGNAALMHSDGNGIPNTGDTCNNAQGVGVPWDTDLSLSNCDVNSGSPPPAPSVGITVLYRGAAFHFYGLANYYTNTGSGSNQGQLIRFFELRQSGGFARLVCTVDNGPGAYSGCVFTAHDGTVVNFPAFIYMVSPSGSPQAPAVFQATNLVKPDGETWTYLGTSARVPGVGWAPGLGQFGFSQWATEYQTLQRPAAIVSNRGYTIKYLWDSTSVTDVVAYNTNQESCAPTASQCTFAKVWPSVHFSYTPYSAATNQFVLNVRDALGYTTSYTTNFFINNGSLTRSPLTVAIKRPSGQTQTLTMDTNYLGRGVNDRSFGGPGNIEPPDPYNTQHVITYNDGKSTWNYQYNYNYVDLHHLGGFPGLGGSSGDQYELYYLDLQLTRTDPLGKTRTVISSPIGAPLSDTDEMNHTTTFDAELPGEPTIKDVEGRIETITKPGGDFTTFTYDNDNNILTSVHQERPSLGTDKLTVSYTYGNGCSWSGATFYLCGKPTAIVDARMNETDYTYDPVHGGMLTETLPPDLTGVRPQTRNGYQQSTAAGQSGAIWLLTSSSTCRSATSANPASCVGSAAEQRTSLTYDTSNLRLKSQTIAAGDGSVTATTSYTYDDVGNVTSVDGPRTDVDDRSYTTYDPLRRKVFEISADPDGAGTLPRQIVHHVYDSDGNEIRTEYGTGSATDGSDFNRVHFKRMTFDPITGLMTKVEEVQP